MVLLVSSDRKPWLKWFCIIRIFIIYHKRKFRDKSDCVLLLCLVAQTCPTPCNLMDYSPPASSVHGILQVRILEWVAVPSSRGPSRPKNRMGSPALQVDSLPAELSGKPQLGSRGGIPSSPLLLALSSFVLALPLSWPPVHKLDPRSSRAAFSSSDVMMRPRTFSSPETLANISF